MSVPAKDSSRKSDSELLIAIAAGNRHALEELYLGYQGRLARFLSRFTQRHENIEEIINDTFMVVWCNGRSSCSSATAEDAHVAKGVRFLPRAQGSGGSRLSSAYFEAGGMAVRASLQASRRVLA